MDGYYDNNINQACVRCQYTCEKCTNATACASCNALKFRQTDTTTNLCKCMSSFYDDGSSEQCTGCSANCLTCVNGVACGSCD